MEIGGKNWSKMRSSPSIELAGKGIIAIQQRYRNAVLVSFQQQHQKKPENQEELLAWLEQLEKDDGRVCGAADEDESTDSSDRRLSKPLN